METKKYSNVSNIILKKTKLVRDINKKDEVKNQIWRNILHGVDNEGNIINDIENLNIEIKVQRKGKDQEFIPIHEVGRNIGSYIVSYCLSDKVIKAEICIRDKKRFLPFAVVFAVVLFLIALILMLGGHEKPKYDGHAYDDPIKPGKIWRNGNLAIPGFKEIYVNKNSNKIKITLANSKVNQAYFKFKVIVKQNSKNIVLEDSNLVKPGNAITEIPTKGLSMFPGRYPMKVDISTFSLINSNAPLNGATVDGTLIIQ